jgi:7,8-dihydroneopterin aldolase/epimerase/oxygenase
MEGFDALIGGDKLIMRGLIFHAFHGVVAEERILGQDLKPAGISDNLSHTFNYIEIYRLVTNKFTTLIYRICIS